MNGLARMRAIENTCEQQRERRGSIREFTHHEIEIRL
jgi:hypothetical protein